MRESSARRRTIAIVGGGFSGAAVAIHLLRAASTGIEVVLVEPAGSIGRGLAYSTSADSHRLNVPAGRLGLDAARESGFVEWLRSRGLPDGSSDFAPRHWLGSYVACEVDRASADTQGMYRRVQARVDEIERHGAQFDIRLSDGATFEADQVVLATGHLPPDAPTVAGTATWSDDGMVADPWRDGGVAGLAASRDVLLVGSGLTAVDIVSQLRDDGHRGRIHLLSRRGLLPQPHRVNEARPRADIVPVAELGDAPSLRAISSAVHEWIRASEAAGGDWRDVMAGLRPWTPRLWQHLGVRDRRQFLRHLLPFWDTHRHRLAPEIHVRLQSLIAQGDVLAHAGRLVAIDRVDGGALRVTWRARGQAGESPLVVGGVVNCTGRTASLARCPSPLLTQLRDAGLLSADDLDQGVMVDATRRLVGANGAPTHGLYYVGPMLKAQHWEATAIPELRAHAREVARTILAELDAPKPADFPDTGRGQVLRAGC